MNDEELEGFEDLFAAPTHEVCMTCRGRGEQTKSRQAGTGDWLYASVTCSDCSGTGVKDANR